jgi:hypothetical protein
MKRFGVVVVGAVLAVAGCGGGDEKAETISAPAAPSSTAQSVRGAPSEAQLRSALLTVNDLPTGFKVEPSDNDEDDDAPLDACARRYNDLDNTPETNAPEANRDFSKGIGTFISQTLAAIPNTTELEHRIREFQAFLSECQTFKLKTSEGKVDTYRISPLSFPKLGDTTFAVSMSVQDSDGFEAEFNLALTRVGKAIQLFLMGGLGAPDTDQVVEIARKGVERLDRVA